MSDALSTYLHDHLAGSHFAVQLLGRLHDQYGARELGRFALVMRAEIEHDQEALQTIVERMAMRIWTWRKSRDGWRKRPVR